MLNKKMSATWLWTRTADAGFASQPKEGSRNYYYITIMAKTKSWMKSSESEMLDQFDQFTLKLPSYGAKYGLTAPQTTAARNDYLWARYGITCTRQFEQEWNNRVSWKNQLLKGPPSTVAQQVPGIGSEFAPPTPPVVLDGILGRWRDMVTFIKGHLNYDPADGMDLDIEPVGSPSQQMKPTAACKVTGESSVQNTVKKDGHEAYIAWCRRGNEPVPVKLGTFTRSSFTDDRPNLTPGQPEVREYTFQYVDGDVPVGEVSDVCRVTTRGWQAAA